MTLGEMIERLSKVDDISWGMYAFSRDVLCRKIDDARKQDMIRKAMECGTRKAEETSIRHGGSLGDRQISWTFHCISKRG